MRANFNSDAVREEEYPFWRGHLCCPQGGVFTILPRFSPLALSPQFRSGFPMLNRRRRKARSWSATAARVEVMEPRALLSATVAVDDGVGYFLSETTAQVLRYDTAAESWMAPVDVTPAVGLPSAVHVDDDGLYVAFNRAVYRYSLDGSNETHLLDATRDVQAIHSDGNLLFVHAGGGRVDGAVSVDKTTNAILDTANGFSFVYYSNSCCSRSGILVPFRR